MSSLAFDVSIPAVVMLVCVIFFDPCLVKRTKCSGNHPGPMKVLARSRYRAAKKRLRAGYDPIASGLSRIAVRGRPFLSERTDHNRFLLLQGWIRRCRNPPRRNKVADYAAANPLRASFLRKQVQIGRASCREREESVDGEM